MWPIEILANKKASKPCEDRTLTSIASPLKMAISPPMFLLENLLDKIGHRYYCPYTSKLNHTIQTPARYDAKHDVKALTSVLIANFGGVVRYYIGASYCCIVYICIQ